MLILAPELYAPLRRLGAQFHASADGVAVAERMLALLDAPPSAARSGRLTPLSPAEAPVRLEAVSFAYPSRPRLVLDRLDLELLPGETVALVGPSGVGKSTVAALLLGFAEPTAGHITVGGVNLADCRLDVWRRQATYWHSGIGRRDRPRRAVAYQGGTEAAGGAISLLGNKAVSSAR